jgi:RNAse (barnase) inhibitor barstar
MNRDDYFGVDIDAVWDTVEKDIPSLQNEIKNLIEKEQNYAHKEKRKKDTYNKGLLC